MNESLKVELIKEYNQKFFKKEFVAGISDVPVSGKVFDEQEILLMTEAVLDGWWTEGRFTAEFEKKLSDYIGMKYCSTVNSGSSANLLAISCLTSIKLPEPKRLMPGDEVITVAAGFPTTINPLIQNGLLPVFIDVELGTYNPSIESIIAAKSSKTKAVFIAHTLGNPYEVDKIAEFCKANDLWLIEDNCDALGSVYNGKKTGSFGDICTLSFYPAHHITTGEGGAVLTNNLVLDRIIKSLRDWGRDCWCPTGKDDTCHRRFDWQLGNLPKGYDHKYTYSEIGYNLKMIDIQAALGLAQLSKLQGFIEKRKENFNILYQGLKNFEDSFILPTWHEAADPSWFGFLLTVRNDAKFKRDDLLKFLNNKKIGTRLLFAGNATKQPYFTERELTYRAIGDLKNTDKIMNDAFWIGVGPLINKEMIDYIISAIRDFNNVN